MTPGELATKTKVAEGYPREWLAHQAASGYLEHNAASGKAALPSEQAMVFADVDSRVYPQRGFRSRRGDVGKPFEGRGRVSVRQRRRVGRASAVPCLFCTVGRFFRADYHNDLVASRLPALNSVCAKHESDRCRLRSRLLDPHHGKGVSESTFAGYDSHPTSVEQARVHADQHGTTANTRFEVAMAGDFPGKDLDLVTCFDCLHDMDDPVGVARRGRETLKRGGSCTISEPTAADSLEANLSFVSTMRLDDDLHPDLARSAGRSGLSVGIVCLVGIVDTGARVLRRTWIILG
jgi:Methyltransferase domain